MATEHLPGLNTEPDGTVVVDTEANLARLLACPVTDLSTEMICFEDRQWRDSSESQRVTISSFLQSAYEDMCSTGRLPYPSSELPPIGADVEVPAVNGKPSPDSRYGVGTVSGYEWWAPLELHDGRSFDGTWRVEVSYYEATGGWCGMPTLGTVISPRLVYVIGSSPGRPYSDMSPVEIESIFGNRRRQ